MGANEDIAVQFLSDGTGPSPLVEIWFGTPLSGWTQTAGTQCRKLAAQPAAFP